MPEVFEVEKDVVVKLFEIKENIKKSIFAVMDGRLTASHLAADVFVLLEELDKLEIQLIGEPLVQEVPQPQAQAQEAQPQAGQQQEAAPAEQQPEQPKPERQ